MKRVSLALLLALAACSGGNQSNVPLAPLPDDQPPDAGVVSNVATPPVEEPEPEPPPMKPLELKLPANTPMVKLGKAGKGKKAKLGYAFTAGAKQQLTLTLEIGSTQTLGGATPMKANVPTLVLTTDTEITGVAADGTASYRAIITGADATAVPDTPVSLEEFKANMMGTIPGTTLVGSVHANGVTGETTLRIEKPDASSLGVMQYFQFALPTWVVVPTEPVGEGATWTTETKRKLQEGVEMTLTTTYTLASVTDGTWVVSGKTAVSGTEQTIQGASVGGFSGKGETTTSVAPGPLFPALVQGLQFAFTVKQGTETLTIEYVTKGSTGKPPNPATAPKP